MRSKASDRGALFWTGKYKDQRMTYRTAVYQWNKQCDQAEVKCEIHQLWHTAATELVNSGVRVEKRGSGDIELLDKKEIDF